MRENIGMTKVKFSFIKASATPLLATLAKIITFLILLVSKRKNFGEITIEIRNLIY